MSKGSHFTCRCVTLVTFSEKVCFNSRSKEAGKGAGGTYREQQQPQIALGGSWAPKATKLLQLGHEVKSGVGGKGYLIFLQLTKFVFSVNTCPPDQLKG